MLLTFPEEKYYYNLFGLFNPSHTGNYIPAHVL